MEEKELKNRINEIVMEVSHSSQLHSIGKTEHQKKAYEIKMLEAVEELYKLVTVNQLSDQQISEEIITEPLKEFTIEELALYNGRDGKPAYVGVNGNVYDVTNKPVWTGGMHFGLLAGQNHSEDFMICHGGIMNVLEGIPIVGKLK